MYMLKIIPSVYLCAHVCVQSHHGSSSTLTRERVHTRKVSKHYKHGSPLPCISWVPIQCLTSTLLQRSPKENPGRFQRKNKSNYPHSSFSSYKLFAFGQFLLSSVASVQDSPLSTGPSLKSWAFFSKRVSMTSSSCAPVQRLQQLTELPGRALTGHISIST